MILENSVFRAGDACLGKHPFFFSNFYDKISLTMYKVLITAPYLQLVIDDYRHIFENHKLEIIMPPPKESLSEDELLVYLPTVHGIICGNDKITERVITNSPNLKVIVKWGTGTDSIDKEAAARRNIPVRNTINAFTDPVADTVLSLILCFARGTMELNDKVKNGKWEKKLNKALHEYTLGVIGVGNVGQAVIKRAEAFGMRVLGNDIKELPYHFMVPLEDLLGESDFVSVNCDLNETSFHLINKETLSLMRPSAYLVNTARGPIVDEAALIEALKNKTIAGAGLDVFENEPLPKSSPLTKMSNVILSPHNANAGQTAWRKVHENSINCLIEGLPINNE